MMLFFGSISALGFGFALLLWFTAGRRRHENHAGDLMLGYAVG
jgi:hypothetical protein